MGPSPWQGIWRKNLSLLEKAGPGGIPKETAAGVLQGGCAIKPGIPSAQQSRITVLRSTWRHPDLERRNLWTIIRLVRKHSLSEVELSSKRLKHRVRRTRTDRYSSI